MLPSDVRARSHKTPPNTCSSVCRWLCIMLAHYPQHYIDKARSKDPA